MPLLVLCLSLGSDSTAVACLPQRRFVLIFNLNIHLFVCSFDHWFVWFVHWLFCSCVRGGGSFWVVVVVVAVMIVLLLLLVLLPGAGTPDGWMDG